MHTVRVLLLGALGATLVGCLPRRDSGPGLRAHGLYLLALGPERFEAAAIERRDGDLDGPRLRTLDPLASSLRPASSLPDRALAECAALPWSSRTELQKALAACPSLAPLHRRDYTWLEPEEGAVLTTALGVVAEERGTIVLRTPSTAVPLLVLPPAPSRKVHWLRDPSRRAIAFEVELAGVPPVTAAYVIPLAYAHARLFDELGANAYAALDLDAAGQHWQRAYDIDPSEVQRPYNLACTAARTGSTERALDFLRRAILLGGPSVKAIARRDPDLAELAALPAFQELVAASTPALP